MKILVTGNEGFAGSHIQKALELEHEVVGLDVRGTFEQWCEDMYAIMNTDIDAVVHAGAISNNQTEDWQIFLWNSYATDLLAERAKRHLRGYKHFPFILFSTLLVEETESNWNERSPYTWSKVQAERFVHNHLPHCTVLRPCVIWGDERIKQSSNGSVPFRLANHSLEYLFTKWRRRYVHVTDVVQAVKKCIDYEHKGTYSVTTNIFWENTDLAKLIDWDGYEWVEDPKSVGFKHLLYHKESLKAPPVPDWEPKIHIKRGLPVLEKFLQKEQS